ESAFQPVISPSDESIFKSLSQGILRKTKPNISTLERKKKNTLRPTGIYDMKPVKEEIASNETESTSSKPETTPQLSHDSGENVKKSQLSPVEPDGPTVKLRRPRFNNTAPTARSSDVVKKVPLEDEDYKKQRRNTTSDLSLEFSTVVRGPLAEGENLTDSSLDNSQPPTAFNGQSLKNNVTSADEYGLGDFMINPQSYSSPDDFRYSLIIKKQDSEEGKELGSCRSPNKT
ncbi:hypothetical protein FHG87_002599, partial [Trinorchestia longiramus]